MSEPTQPDPQVAASDEVDAMTDEQVVDELLRVARKPLTLADIPAGQGPASLYLTKRGVRLMLRYKAYDGVTAYLETEPNHQERFGFSANASEALWEHLAATLPTVEATP
jgi:hypothetical protein